MLRIDPRIHMKSLMIKSILKRPLKEKIENFYATYFYIIYRFI